MVAGPFLGTTEWFADHLHATLGFESLGHEVHHFDWWTAITGTMAGVVGLALSYRIYAGRTRFPAGAQRLRGLYEASFDKFHIDEIYGWVVVRPTRALAGVCDFLDAYLVDRLVIGVAKLPRLFGRACWPGTRMG